MSILKKIIEADPNTYIIFYVKECPYCKSALDLLRSKKLNYKGYLIDDIVGGMGTLLKNLRDNAQLVEFDKSHETKPIIFLGGKFIGGYTELLERLD